MTCKSAKEIPLFFLFVNIGIGRFGIVLDISTLNQKFTFYEKGIFVISSWLFFRGRF